MIMHVFFQPIPKQMVKIFVGQYKLSEITYQIGEQWEPFINHEIITNTVKINKTFFIFELYII